MTREEDDIGADSSLANMSALTASMSFDDGDSDSGEVYDRSTFADTSDHSESEIGWRNAASPPPSDQLLDSSRPTSPPPIVKKEPIEDPEVRAFLSSAERLVDPNVLNEREKFLVVISTEGSKHKFSRNWVAKRSLSSVVEKPERLKAACIGIGLAQTVSAFKLIKSTERTSLYCPHFETVHGKDWATQLYALCSTASSKLANRELEVPESWPYYDIYLAPKTVEALEGNIKAMEVALDEIFTGDQHRAFVVVRPPGHHCHEDEASGFCIINNAHIAIQYAKAHHAITHAIIIDFDLHHGDGSQQLVWKLGYKAEGPAELPIGYFSLHDINSFPCEAGYAQPEQLANASVCFVAHNCAIWNTHFKPYNSETEFNEIYTSEYSTLFKKAAEFLNNCKQSSQENGKRFKPLIVVSAGFDGSEFESPGMQRHKVNVPTSFYNRFTRDCVALAENYGDGHLISLLEGGYSPSAVATGVFSHLTGLAELNYDSGSWCAKAVTPTEIDLGMRQRWRAHPEKWTARGIELARTLFPALEQQSDHPKSAPEIAEVEHKHNLRERHYRWSQ